MGLERMPYGFDQIRSKLAAVAYSLLAPLSTPILLLSALFVAPA
jgi:hypothetical protein